MTTETGIMIRETDYRIAHTGRVVDRPCGETVTSEMNESLTGETVTTADLQESTTRT